MKKKLRLPPLLAVVVFLVFFLSSDGIAKGISAGDREVAIFLSLNIRPYYDALDGIYTALDSLESHTGKKIAPTVFRLADYDRDRVSRLEEKLSSLNPDLLIAIGPEALRLAALELDRFAPPLLYSMVLHPRSITGPEAITCGVAMDIPLPEQLRVIRNTLPDIRRLGLLYDPLHNETRFRKAASALKDARYSAPLSLVPIAVSLKDMRRKLDRAWADIDALWFIPDQTVNGESLIRQILKESIARRIPAIGFNRLFYDSGAALSFVLDYNKIGLKTGRMAAVYLNEGKCRSTGPEYTVWINSRVVRRIGATVNPDEARGITEGP